MRLNHNAMAFLANNNLNAINRNLTKSMERLSSGYKINKSSDDPAGKAISQRMNSQIRGLDRAVTNANDGISLIQTAEGALNEIHSVLARMRELAVRAANETYAEEDKDAMQDELVQLQDEVNRIADTTDFNGRSLLNGELNKKGYVDVDSLKIAELGGDITPNVYGLSITGVGTQAMSFLTPLPAGTVITKEQEGNLLINRFEIEIKAGMQTEEVNKKIRDAAGKIGIDYDSTSGVLTTREYGSEQSITVTSNNKELAALLGAKGTTIYGKDATAEFTTGANGERIGFEDTATIETQGNRIKVTDKNGFVMVFDTDPQAGSYTANITTLSAGPMVVQIGNNEGQTLDVNINMVTTKALEIDKINIYTNEYATKALDKIDQAIAKVSAIRSSLGAYQNRLDYTVTNLETANENLTSAVSRMADTDMAEEITEYTEKNVLSQSALQILTKANASPEKLLQLFQR